MDKSIKSRPSPKVTVLMSVYNGGKYLKEAIDSILKQSFTDFEFLIINDGSTDNTETIIKSYSDKRIELLKNQINEGLVSSLNKGIQLSRGEYIARMDADDLSLPKRLEKQVEFLDKNCDCGILGTSVFLIDKKREIREIFPTIFEDEDIRIGFLFRNMLTHGSVMIRKSLLIKNNLFYSANAVHFEDYDLWVRMLYKTKITNLSDVLYCWMSNPLGITSTKSKEMKHGVQLLKRKINCVTKIKILDYKQLYNYYSKKKKYQKDKIYINGKIIRNQLLIGYQYFLFRYALLSIERYLITNFIILLFISFVINPENFVHILFKPIKYRLKNLLLDNRFHFC